MKKFEVGHTYQTRSIGDHDCIFEIEVGQGRAVHGGVHGGVQKENRNTEQGKGGQDSGDGDGQQEAQKATGEGAETATDGQNGAEPEEYTGDRNGRKWGKYKAGGERDDHPAGNNESDGHL